MRILSSLILAGAAVTGLAVLAPTLARELESHTVTVQLPGGGMETIAYSGKVAPKVSFRAIPVESLPASSFADPFAVSWNVFPSFAALDRISAAMDRQMDAMMHQAQMLSAGGQPLSNAVLKGMPQGSSFSMVSQTFSNGACVQTTRITQAPGQAKPQVVSQTSGNCGADSHSAAPAADPGMKQINYRLPAVHPAHSAL
jgi:hypothetical protein